MKRVVLLLELGAVLFNLSLELLLRMVGAELVNDRVHIVDVRLGDSLLRAC